MWGVAGVQGPFFQKEVLKVDEISDTKSVVGSSSNFDKKCFKCKKLSLGVSVVPIKYGVVGFLALAFCPEIPTF